MKYFLFLGFGFFFINASAQEVPEETFTLIVDYNCACYDSISVEQPISKVETAISDCYNQSLTTYLTKKKKWRKYLADSTNAANLYSDVWAELQACEKTKALVTRMKEIPVPLSEIPADLFLTSSFLAKYNLKLVQSEGNFIAWSSDATSMIQRFVDIRWVFENNEDAWRYHRANLKANSEDGQPLTETIDLPGAQDLYICRESASVEKMIKQMLLTMRQYYFLFVVDNVVFKLFIATDTSVTLQDVKAFAEEAIARLRLYQQK